MKRIPLKEVLVLLLPALILLGAGFWWQKREQRNAIKKAARFVWKWRRSKKLCPHLPKSPKVSIQNFW
jgi:hypothetical protein